MTPGVFGGPAGGCDMLFLSELWRMQSAPKKRWAAVANSDQGISLGQVSAMPQPKVAEAWRSPVRFTPMFGYFSMIFYELAGGEVIFVENIQVLSIHLGNGKVNITFKSEVNVLHVNSRSETMHRVGSMEDVKSHIE